MNRLIKKLLITATCAIFVLAQFAPSQTSMAVYNTSAATTAATRKFRPRLRPTFVPSSRARSPFQRFNIPQRRFDPSSTGSRGSRSSPLIGRRW